MQIWAANTVTMATYCICKITGYDYLTFYPKTNQFYNFHSPTVAYFLYPPFFHIRGR